MYNFIRLYGAGRKIKGKNTTKQIKSKVVKKSPNITCIYPYENFSPTKIQRIEVTLNAKYILMSLVVPEFNTLVFIMKTHGENHHNNLVIFHTIDNPVF